MLGAKEYIIKMKMPKRALEWGILKLSFGEVHVNRRLYDLRLRLRLF